MLKAVLIGNLGGDPDVRYTADGRMFVRFNVATNERRRNQEGEWEDRTEWVRVTVFGQRAESISQYLRKGSRVYVEGRLEARPWTDQQQQIRAGLEVVANDVQFMSTRAEDEARSGGDAPRSADDAPRSGGGSSRPSGPRPQQRSSDDMELEDLPF